MPQRNPANKNPEPTSLRRSPRLLQLTVSPITPNPTSKTTSSTPKSKNISSRKSQIRSTNLAKSSLYLKDCVNGSNGSRNYAISANGSRRKSNFGGGIVSNEVTSLVVQMPCNDGTINGSVFSNTRCRRKLKQVSIKAIDSFAIQDFVDSPETPIQYCNRKRNDGETSGSPVLSLGDSERRVTRNCSKRIGGNVESRMIEKRKLKDIDLFDKRVGETSGSLVLSLGDSERRVTRSAKKMVGNVEIRKIENSKLKGSDLFDNRVGGGVLRRCVRPVRGAIGNGNDDRKGKEDGVHRILVCGLARVRCDSLDPCATPGVARGRRFSRKSMDGMKGKNDDLCEKIVGNFERRITRSATKRTAKESDLCGQDRERGNVRGKGESRKAKIKNEECNGTIKMCRSERGKRVKKALVTSFSVRLEAEKVALGDIVEKKERGKQGGHKPIIASCDITQGNKLIGVKRKRNQGRLLGRDQGWTNEQEAALQSAYFAAKPSPHFWKKVSKLVPGKSAQECFDKVHSASLTPLSTRPSSRLKKQNSPSEFFLQGNDLLNPIPTKNKKRCKTKQKSHVTRRNVRHLLQKYCHDNEADLFSVLEPSGNPLPETLKLKAVHLTPIQSLGSPSSSGFKKRVSRLSGLGRSPLISPPVLKKVKNMALHEKYIDQLHVREGKRKVVSSCYSKSVQCQKDLGAQNSAQWKDVIKAAKDALVSDARDVIETFRQSQTNLMELYSDSEEVALSDNDEDDMGIFHGKRSHK